MYRGVLTNSRALQSKVVGLLEDEFYRILSRYEKQGGAGERLYKDDDCKQIYACLEHFKKDYDIDEEVEVMVGSLESMIGVFLFKNPQEHRLYNN